MIDGFIAAGLVRMVMSNDYGKMIRQVTSKRNSIFMIREPMMQEALDYRGHCRG